MQQDALGSKRMRKDCHTKGQLEHASLGGWYLSKDLGGDGSVGIRETGYQGQDVTITHALLLGQLPSLGPWQPSLHLCSLFPTRYAMDRNMAARFPGTLAPFLKNPKSHIGVSLQLILVNWHNCLTYRLFKFLFIIFFSFGFFICDQTSVMLCFFEVCWGLLLLSFGKRSLPTWCSVVSTYHFTGYWSCLDSVPAGAQCASWIFLRSSGEEQEAGRLRTLEWLEFASSLFHTR